MFKLTSIFCVLFLLAIAEASLPKIEPIGRVPRKCRPVSFKKLKWISLAFLDALDTCFNRDSGDGLFDVYRRDALVFGTAGVLVGIDEIITTFPACKVPAPNGAKGFQFIRILESIAGNSVYYLFTVRAPGFKDYNFSTSITVCRSKIVRTVSTLDTQDLMPIGA